MKKGYKSWKNVVRVGDISILQAMSYPGQAIIRPVESTENQ